MPTEEQLLEIHRLALLGGECAIAQDVTARLADAWERPRGPSLGEMMGISKPTLCADVRQAQSTSSPDGTSF